MNRCFLLGRRVCAALILSCAAFLGVATGGDKLPERPPNIVFILADDLGFGEIGAYGQQHIRTPAIDALAREGMRFTNHYAGSTVCAPSRSTLMTGLHTGHTRVRHNFGVDPASAEPVRVGLEADDHTVAELLQAAGYRTGVIGKWGLGEPGTAGVPLQQGFETFFGFLNQARAHHHYPEWVWDQDRPFQLSGNADGGETTYVHDLFTSRALDFVDATRDDSRPFFLYLAYTLPHSELKVPADARVDAADPNAVFGAMVERMDRDIGRLMSRIEALGLGDDTVVFFTSDNGPHDQEGKDNERFRAAGPFRGIKRDVFEGGIRVPMIVRWPGRIVPGSETAHISAFWDFLPTAAELAGTAAPAGIDGISFLPALRGLPNVGHDALYWEYVHKGQARRAVRMGDWKAVIQGRSSQLQLYHLPSDPGESQDLAARYPQILAQARRAMASAHTPDPRFPLSVD